MNRVRVLRVIADVAVGLYVVPRIGHRVDDVRRGDLLVRLGEDFTRPWSSFSTIRWCAVLAPCGRAFFFPLSVDGRFFATEVDP